MKQLGTINTETNQCTSHDKSDLLFSSEHLLQQLDCTLAFNLNYLHLFKRNTHQYAPSVLLCSVLGDVIGYPIQDFFLLGSCVQVYRGWAPPLSDTHSSYYLHIPSKVVYMLYIDDYFDSEYDICLAEPVEANETEVFDFLKKWEEYESFEAEFRCWKIEKALGADL